MFFTKKYGVVLCVFQELLLHSCYYWQAVLDRVAPKPSARTPSTPDPRKYASPKKFSYLSSVKWSPHVQSPGELGACTCSYVIYMYMLRLQQVTILIVCILYCVVLLQL